MKEARHRRIISIWDGQYGCRLAVTDRNCQTLAGSALRTLTDQREQAFAQPWSIEDAPRHYIEALTKAIVGIEIAIDQIEGKCKASQNQPEANQVGVMDGLRGLNSPESLRMAQLVRQRGLKNLD